MPPPATVTWQRSPPNTGVHGKPELAVTMPLTSQPPASVPTRSSRSRKNGSCHMP